MFRDLTGKVFTRLTVLEYVGRGPNWNAQWACRCVCGNEIIALGTTLTGGRKKSCGCLPRELSSARQKTHGQGGSPTYNSWHDMMRRCYVSHNKTFPNYGGRGISVCERWHMFENFLEDMGERPSDKTLERTDNDGDYCPENCVWADKITQMNNTRANRLITFNGKTQSLAMWARELHLNYGALKARITKYCWPVERAFTEPLRVWPSQKI